MNTDEKSRWRMTMALELRPPKTHEYKADGCTPPPGPLTYEQFLEWADEDTCAEWVDGKVVMSRSASVSHQDLVGFLAVILRFFNEENGQGIVLTTPFQMRLHDVRAGASRTCCSSRPKTGPVFKTTSLTDRQTSPWRLFRRKALRGTGK